MNIDGVIFDLDGTLLDSMPIWRRLGADYLRRLGIAAKDGLADTLSTMTLPQAATYFQAEYGVTLTACEIQRGINCLIEEFYFHRAPAKEGAIELILRLRRRGTKLCVLTATEHYLAKAALSRLELLSCFEQIVTCGDFGRGKDHPAIFEHALCRLGTGKDVTVVVDDAPHAIKTAKAAGFHTVAVYDEAFAADRAELQKTADVYLTSLLQWRDDFV